jgi:hypothetical protein
MRLKFRAMNERIEFGSLPPMLQGHMDSFAGGKSSRQLSVMSQIRFNFDDPTAMIEKIT